MKSIFCVLVLFCLIIINTNAFASSLEDGDIIIGNWQGYLGDPGERYAINMVLDSDHKQLILFGGETNIFETDTTSFPKFKIHDDLWIFDIGTKKWNQVEVKGDKPSKRAYYASSYDPIRKGMWLHGGFDGGMLGDLWFYDAEKQTWEKIVVDSGLIPAPRDAHALYYNPNQDQLLLFGGLLDFNTLSISNELWAFDIKEKKWSKLPEGPKGRFLFCSAFELMQEQLFLCGGLGEGGAETDNILWKYDLKVNSWISILWENQINYWAGDMLLLNNPSLRLLIWGGAASNDEGWYDTEKTRWYINDKKSQVEPRGFHSVCYDPEAKQVFVYGGTDGNFFGKCVPAILWIGTLESYSMLKDKDNN